MPLKNLENRLKSLGGDFRTAYSVYNNKNIKMYEKNKYGQNSNMNVGYSLHEEFILEGSELTINLDIGEKYHNFCTGSLGKIILGLKDIIGNQLFTYSKNKSLENNKKEYRYKYINSIPNYNDSVKTDVDKAIEKIREFHIKYAKSLIDSFCSLTPLV